jgi:membrane protease YdiL (CAAX protease family)
MAIPISLLIPGISFSPGMEGMMDKYASMIPSSQVETMKNQISMIGGFMPLVFILQSLIAGITINAIAAFGEEYLWRGFLLKEMKGYGWIKASLFIGFIWGLWHAPLIIQGHNYPAHPYIGILMMIIWCTLLTPSMIYFTVKTKSVITSAVMHGTLNASAGISIAWIMGGNDLTVGITGLAGFIALLIVNIGLFVYDKRSKVRTNEMMKDY